MISFASAPQWIRARFRQANPPIGSFGWLIATGSLRCSLDNEYNIYLSKQRIPPVVFEKICAEAGLDSHYAVTGEERS